MKKKKTKKLSAAIYQPLTTSQILMSVMCYRVSAAVFPEVCVDDYIRLIHPEATGNGVVNAIERTVLKGYIDAETSEVTPDGVQYLFEQLNAEESE